MSILDLIKLDESTKYISLKEAINSLTENTNSTIHEVAIYLLNKDVPRNLNCYIRTSDYKITEISGQKFEYGAFRSYGENWAYEYLTNISKRHNCTNWDELNTYGAGYWDNWDVIFTGRNIGLLENTYWHREAFFNLESIKALNLFEERPLEFNQNLSPIWDTNYLSLQIYDNPDFEEKDIYSYTCEPENLQFDSEQNKPEAKEVPLFYLNDSFTLIEASSVISGDDPIKMNRCINDTNFDQNFPEFSEAYSFINSAICAGVLPKSVIPADQLKTYLKNKGRVIIGFNDISLSLPNKFENFDTQSTLKLNISSELDSNFIRIFTAVEFFKKVSSLRYDEVIIYIKKIFSNLTLYTLDENLTPVTGHNFCDVYCINHLSDILKNADKSINMLNAAKYSVDEYFWDKNEFFNNEDVISFDLTKKNYNLFLIASLLNPDDEHIFLNSSDINTLQKIIHNRAQDFNAYMQIEFDELKSNDELLVKMSELEKLKKENEYLKSELMQSLEQITKLETVQKISDVPDELIGLKRRNQLAQDRQGMARIIALSFWEKDQSILIGEMADKVYRTMIDYCKDDLPQLTDTLKTWIRPIATKEAQKKGRPKSSS